MVVGPHRAGPRTGIGYITGVRSRANDRDDDGRAVASRPEAGRRRGSGELEAEILAALWSEDAALTPGQVHRIIGTDLAYTTVVTCLTRLHDKGVLTRHRVGRAYAYRPVVDQPGLAARRMRQVLDAEDDRRVTLTRFVSELSAEDERVLRALLADPRSAERTRMPHVAPTDRQGEAGA